MESSNKGNDGGKIMKIKEFSIIRYGPLPNTGRILLHNFNLFWGKNEDGKTLTIDALVKLLLGRNVRDFERIDRVEENPEGYVIIKYEGKEIKLPEKRNLTKVTNLSPTECRNIFIIRNSDLSIARESEFYTNVTDRLTGLRTEDISNIKNALREIGKITPGGEFRDVKDEKLKTRVKNAKELIKKIDDLREEIKKKRYDEVEEESVKLREEIESIRHEIERLDHARKREKYEKGKEALDSLREFLEKLKDLEIYNEKDEQLWRDCEKDIEKYSKEKEEVSAKLRKKEEELEKISEKLTKKEQNFQILKDKKRKIEDEVKPELKNYEMGVGKIKSEETKNKFYTGAVIASIVLLSISMLGAIINPSPIFYGLSAVFLISTTVFVVLKFSFVQKRAHFAAVFERIKLSCSKFKLDAETPEEIYSNIQKFEEEYQKEHDDLQDIRRKKENLEENIKELRGKKIPEIEDKIESAKKEIEKIKSKSKEENRQEYTKKLKSKQQLQTSIEKKVSVLESLLEKKSKKPEDNISYWDEEIGKLEEYRDKAKDIKYSETDKSKLEEEEKQKLEEELEEINQRMESVQKKMEDIKRDANEILRMEEHLYCRTSVDLEAIKNKLQEFITENENTKDNVLEIIKILDEIEAEEKEKISELFGKESSISNYFNKITNGLYEEVIFEQETGKIKVKRRDGAILEAEKLSGGAYDQLYFSIRLALGEKLLRGKKGFFIMDDPFIKADSDRLQRQIEMLRKISESGWQVIYFSAKSEIKDTLKEDIESGAINYVEPQGIFPSK